jgi:outer membrane receptor protein involved in Fe transport
MFLIVPSVQSQIVTGTVSDKSTAAKLSGAFVRTSSGTTVVTDESGQFTITVNNVLQEALIISYVGFNTDTFYLKGNTEIKIFLSPLVLNEVEINSRKVTRQDLTPMNVEVINSADLLKDACCNLSESFENSATVDVSFSDAVSGAKEIRMLGLDGVYSQILIENMPGIRGLGNTFGLNHIPGSLMSSIQVNKGAGSVVNGYESTTGQINIELKKPLASEKFLGNFFINQDLRTELNLLTARPISEKWSSLTFLHGDINWWKQDMNHDHFIDNPLIKNAQFLQRISYQSGKIFGFYGTVNVNVEDRVGGSVHYSPRRDALTQNEWGTQLRTYHSDASFKTSFNLPDENFIGIQYKYLYHQQFGNIGRRMYKANEHFGYFNFIYQKNWGEEEQVIKAGVSFLADNVNEELDSTLLQRTEIVPGIFTEGSFNFGADKKVMLVAGFRTDFHNMYGPFVSPRVNLKWNIVYDLSLRLSAGKGFRVPTIFAENYGWLANSRQIVISRDLKFEEAWNYGASLTYKFNAWFREGYITADFYRTDFLHQVIVDMENVRQLQFYNLEGKSFANAFQVEVSYEVAKGLDAKLAYKFEQSKTEYKSGTKIFPLRPQHRGLFSLQYQTPKKNWKFNAGLNWFGKTRIPETVQNDLANQRALLSKDWFQLNAQITYTIKKWEVYVGGENLINFIQQNPIISSEAPFSNQFDASLVWGPLRGAMAFAGLRFSLK